MRRPRKLEIWIACPECHGEGRAFLTSPNQKHQQCYRCRGSRYVRCKNTKRVWYEFTCTTTALKNLNRQYWLQLTDSLLAHIEKLENNRFSLVNELAKEQKKNLEK